jgi:hypothetical protein
MYYLEQKFGIPDATESERAAYRRRARAINADCGNFAAIQNRANDLLAVVARRGGKITRADRLALVALATAYGEREARYNAVCERNA